MWQEKQRLGLGACFLLGLMLQGSALAKQPGHSPVKVFVLAGQSNMQGHGKVMLRPEKNDGKGTLEYLVKNKESAALFAHTVDREGNWLTRPDCWIWYLERSGNLGVGYGAGKDMIGPEFQFGHRVAGALENQVLLVKTAWGGKSLVADFRPPSSGGEVGPYYSQMIKHVRDVLANLKEHFPSYNGRGYELSGFGWHQGWNDGLKQEWVDQYEENLVNLVKDLRKEWKVADLPVVIANSGFGGYEQKTDRRLGIMAAQEAVPGRLGGVTTVETRGFFRPVEVSPSGQRYHWNHNAETHFLIGDAMGKAMVSLLKSRQE